ncbi:hypothetical protein Acor_14120 [Acrocarpospora corrugata]|uniref:Uncharacterized protein n=1 Tax=Acrocarpospora corrugata TaxID=35763 RepID=A0A5M3VT02_9ACTN|nr:hypothetical protein Acor_14120 [Acrocarpospora corrugata]
MVLCMHEMKEADWERLIYQLQSGHCTPFVGAGASMGVLPSGATLSRKLARQWGYPGRDSDELHRVTQFGGIKYGDLIHAKELVRDELATGALPDFTDPCEPYGLLAGFNLPVYVTTNYDDFIARALLAAGKRPNTAICPWNAGIAFDEKLFSSEAGWDPKPETPLVYHLHGALHDPASFVLAEEDYLEFLRNLAAEGLTGNWRMLPPSIQAALTRRPLLFVGYSLQDWTFRVLFQELSKSVPGINRRRHVSIQVAPTPTPSGWSIRDLERQLDWYYRGWEISVFWGGTREFCTELRSRMVSTT